MLNLSYLLYHSVILLIQPLLGLQLLLPAHKILDLDEIFIGILFLFVDLLFLLVGVVRVNRYVQYVGLKIHIVGSVPQSLHRSFSTFRDVPIPLNRAVKQLGGSALVVHHAYPLLVDLGVACHFAVCAAELVVKSVGGFGVAVRRKVGRSVDFTHNININFIIGCQDVGGCADI